MKALKWLGGIVVFIILVWMLTIMIPAVWSLLTTETITATPAVPTPVVVSPAAPTVTAPVTDSNSMILIFGIAAVIIVGELLIRFATLNVRMIRMVSFGVAAALILTMGIGDMNIGWDGRISAPTAADPTATITFWQWVQEKEDEIVRILMKFGFLVVGAAITLWLLKSGHKLIALMFAVPFTIIVIVVGINETMKIEPVREAFDNLEGVVSNIEVPSVSLPSIPGLGGDRQDANLQHADTVTVRLKSDDYIALTVRYPVRGMCYSAEYDVSEASRIAHGLTVPFDRILVEEKQNMFLYYVTIAEEYRALMDADDTLEITARHMEWPC